MARPAYIVRKILLGPVLFLPFLMGCQHTPRYNSSSLDDLQTLSYGTSRPAQVNGVRIQGLRDTALSLGARGGLAQQAEILNRMLLKNEDVLQRVFNFNAIMLDKNVLPPVLIEGRNTLDIAGPDAIRIADRNYQILEQARFVTAPPTWRHYLWMSFSAPEPPDRSLLPKTNIEKTLWKQYVAEGWRAGLQQGDAIFLENLGRLKRDYEGMLRYRTLLAQNMVSAPYVAQTDMGITGDSSNISINDRVLRITAFPELQLNPDQWKTEIIPHEQ
jgi:defect-in-organelle-trafficking protein DotC